MVTGNVVDKDSLREALEGRLCAHGTSHAAFYGLLVIAEVPLGALFPSE